MSKSPFQVRHVLCCDTVRIENNGKELLIGVYSGSVVFRQFPAALFGLTFRVEVVVAEQMDSEFAWTLVDPQRNEIGRAVTRMRIGPAPHQEFWALHVPMGPLQISSEGRYGLLLSIDKKRPREVFSILMRVPQPGDPTYMPPPPAAAKPRKKSSRKLH